MLCRRNWDAVIMSTEQWRLDQVSMTTEQWRLGWSKYYFRTMETGMQ